MLTHNTTTVESFLALIPALRNYDPSILERVSTQGRYEHVLRRQAQDLRDFETDEELTLDANMDYSTVEGLSNEVKERLNLVRPASIVSSGLFIALLFFSAILALKFGSDFELNYN